MAYSYIEYTADGSTNTFSIPFSYTAQQDISVYVAGSATTAFTFTSSSTISLTSTPTNGQVVRVARTTSLTNRAVDFSNGAILTENDLDKSAEQLFFASQEAIDTAGESLFKTADGKFDAQSRVIKNVADPVAAQDAVTKNWAETSMDSQVVQATSAKDAAQTSETNAATSESNASSSASSASGSASTATTKASQASTSASNAALSATASAASATASALSESNASASEGNASSSSTSATSSAATATTKANEAATSASSALSSKNASATSETNAANSASSASTDASTATTKASQASTSATNSASSATASASSASTASTQASTATTQASNAASSASSASGSASTATTQASTATTKANEAATSASNAAVSAASAASAFDSFDDRYLGAKASAPTTDNDGDPLQTGNLYFLTGTGMQVWDGAAWIAASSSGNVSMYVFEFTATSGQTTFSGNDTNGQALSYTAGNIHVTYGGFDLPTADYTATNGTSIVLDDGAEVGKIVRVVAFESFVVADTYTQAQADARYKSISASEGGPSLGTDSVIRTNAKTIAENITFAGTENGMSIGPITVNSGYTVTVTSGSTWVVL